jgi:dUTP pyrophosphatase
VIDSDYRGPVGVILHNMGMRDRKFPAKSRIAQLVVMPHLTMPMDIVQSWNTETERNTGGFGSTGK